MVEIVKYPRTYHIEGSRFQPGDEDLDSVPFSAIYDRPTIIEEKVDGANAAISFAPDGKAAVIISQVGREKNILTYSNSGLTVSAERCKKC
jgi:hypothetical protein